MSLQSPEIRQIPAVTWIGQGSAAVCKPSMRCIRVPQQVSFNPMVLISWDRWPNTTRKEPVSACILFPNSECYLLRHWTSNTHICQGPTQPSCLQAFPKLFVFLWLRFSRNVGFLLSPFIWVYLPKANITGGPLKPNKFNMQRMGLQQMEGLMFPLQLRA